MDVLCDATKCSCYTNYTMYKLLIGLGAFVGIILGYNLAKRIAS